MMKLLNQQEHNDAVRDNLLIDVSEIAKDSGIDYSIFITRAVWHDSIDTVENRSDKLIVAKIKNICTSMNHEIKRTHSQTDEFIFPIISSTDNDGINDVQLKCAIQHKDDSVTPIVVIMLPNEK